MYGRCTNLVTLLAALILQPVLPLSAEDKPVQVTFLSYPAQEQSKPLQLKTGDTAHMQVATPHQEISEAYEVPKMETWTLGKLRDKLGGETEFVTMASCKSIDASHQLIILGNPIDPMADDFQMIAVDCDPASFKGGSMMFINRTKVAIMPQIEDDKAVIQPNDSAVIAPPMKDDRIIAQCQISFQRDEKMKLMVDTRWPLHKNVRSVIIFYVGENGRILMHTIRQQLP